MRLFGRTCPAPLNPQEIFTTMQHVEGALDGSYPLWKLTVKESAMYKDRMIPINVQDAIDGIYPAKKLTKAEAQLYRAALRDRNPPIRRSGGRGGRPG